MHVASPDSTESRLNACTVGTSICSAIFLMLQHEQSPILALDDPCQVVGQQTRDYDVNGNEQQLGNIPGNVFHNAGAWPRNRKSMRSTTTSHCAQSPTTVAMTTRNDVTMYLAPVSPAVPYAFSVRTVLMSRKAYKL